MPLLRVLPDFGPADLAFLGKSHNLGRAALKLHVLSLLQTSL